LDELVRNNPDTNCTPCRKKGLKCTTKQIENPTRPNKSGRRIEEAKKAFGQVEGELPGEGVDQQEWVVGGGDELGDVDMQAIHVEGLGYAQQGMDAGAMEGMEGLEGFDFASFINTSSTPSANYTQESNDYMGNTPFGANLHIGDHATNSATDLDTLFQPALPIQNSQFASENAYAPSGSADLPFKPTFPNTSRLDYEEQGRDIWVKHALADHSRIIHLPTPRHTPRDNSDLLEGHPVSSDIPPMGIGHDNMLFDPGLNVFIQKDSPGSLTTTSSPNWQDHLRRDRTPHVQGSSRGSTSTAQSHGALTQASTASRNGSSRAIMSAQPADPWRIYAENQQVVLWGRREHIQEDLADRALGIELSKHLIKVYFHHVHATFPVSPDYHPADHR
jgi:hypothetical protein